MRYPAVAGQFYPSDAEELKKTIKKLYLGPLGPGLLSYNFSGEKDIIGVVSPHAGYIFSGQVAAHSYLELSRGMRPDTIVIIGPNHSGMGSPLSVTQHDYLTPLGVAPTDKEMVRSVLKHGKGVISDDVSAHRYEHSVEVQVPFIQDIDLEVNIVPVVMRDQRFESAVALADAIESAAKELNRHIMVVASTDFSHYVPPHVAKEKDALAIEKIEQLDSRGLYSTVKRYGISMCGYGPVMTLLEIAKKRGGTYAKLLKHTTSGDIKPMEEVVGYSSIAVYGSDGRD